MREGTRRTIQWGIKFDDGDVDDSFETYEGVTEQIATLLRMVADGIYDAADYAGMVPVRREVMHIVGPWEERKPTCTTRCSECRLYDCGYDYCRCDTRVNGVNTGPRAVDVSTQNPQQVDVDGAE